MIIKKTPTVSIIIPTYNYGKFLHSAIQSALSQNEYPCEIIVVDDGSTDNTPNIVKKFLKSITYIRQENTGLSSARNTGISISHGDYLQFLDADDLLGKGAVAAKVKIMEKNPSIGLVVCRNEFFHSEPIHWWSSFFVGAWRLYSDNLDIHLCFSNIAPPHAYLIRRDLALSIGEFDTGLLACEDYDYWLRAAFAGQVPVFSSNGKVYYRRHRASMSANCSQQTQWDAIMHIRLYNLMKKYPDFPENNRLSGLMAFLAGTLRTINRLCDYSLSVPIELYKICEEAGGEIKKESEKENININLIFYFYLLLIEEHIESIKSKESFKKNLRVFLIQALKNMRLPTKKSSIAWKSLKFALFDNKAGFIQRYKLAKTSIRSFI
ncbi:MAG TPA: glycosyltransferase [Candidatus Competibacteraceae bacterium]|nr:glycosyltransferase [Candidatus Competibacteraceae bacterium]